MILRHLLKPLLLLTTASGLTGLLSGAERAALAQAPSFSLTVRLSWGHRSAPAKSFRVGCSDNQVVVGPIRPHGFELEDRLQEGVAETRAGSGDVDGITVGVSWSKAAQPVRKPHSIWQFLLDHGEPGQVARLTDDPGLTPDAPVLTVLMAADGTRGFSIGLEQLLRHRAMWLPEHDVFVTMAEAPVEFAAHLAALKGERVLDCVKRQSEASLREWTGKWADFGDPTRPHHGQETEWLGTCGHLTGLVARHGSLYKFGVDRWGSVRPDFASPHQFRFDPLWPGCQWKGQRIVEGLPILITELERDGQRCEIEQFAVPLGVSTSPSARSSTTAKAGKEAGGSGRRGEVASVLLTRARLSGTGIASLGFRLATQRTNRHPELRGEPGCFRVVDRETGAVWLLVEADNSFAVRMRPAIDDAKDPRVEFDCVGKLTAGVTHRIDLKLASPVVPSEGIPDLEDLHYPRARAATVNYWEGWLARGAQFEVPERTVNDLFRASLWHALMLPRHRTDERGAARIDLPYSNFAYGQLNADWPINQAVYVDYMIYGLRGHYAVAEEEFAAMYHTQQKPDGRVSGYAEWGVYSPSMLYSIGQNFLLSRDRGSFERLLPASLKALDWCLGEVAREQKAAEAPGLIVAPLNDLTHEARAWAFPNAYFVAGLEIFGRALAAYGHPRATAVSEAAATMRTHVERAFARASVKSPAVQLADGTWNNFVPCDALAPRRLLDVWYPTDVDCGPLHLARLRAIDPQGWLTTALLHDHEDNLFLNQWGMANEPVYNQHATTYLWRDEPEAAIRAFYSMMACAFSHRQLTPLEHRWAWGQYYMPPSTDGAWFELYRNLLVQERDHHTLWLCPATPRRWLEPGHTIRIEGAPTYFGPLNLRLESRAGAREIRAEMDLDAEDRKPRTVCLRFRHPQQKEMRSVTVNGRRWVDFDRKLEWVRFDAPSAQPYQIVVRY